MEFRRGSRHPKAHIGFDGFIPIEGGVQIDFESDWFQV